MQAQTRSLEAPEEALSRGVTLSIGGAPHPYVSTACRSQPVRRSYFASDVDLKRPLVISEGASNLV